MLFLWVIYPIVSFELYYAPKFGKILTPLASDDKISLSTALSSMFELEAKDYTKASMWFPKAQIHTEETALLTTSYTLSIPKLNIVDAIVTINSDDLTKSLIHFTGPIPGNFGNPVIFGHSTIPWLYDPKNYKTIFSKLPELKKGDVILAFVEGVTYTYQVEDMKVVTANDVSVLNQQYIYPTITLVTCVPPGTYLKRLIVTGKLYQL